MTGVSGDFLEDADGRQPSYDLIGRGKRRPDQSLYLFGADDRMLVEILQDAVAVSGGSAELFGDRGSMFFAKQHDPASCVGSTPY